MDKKITLIEHDNGWGWYVLEYGNKVWYNIASGHETTYEAACTAALKEYRARKGEADDSKTEDED